MTATLMDTAFMYRDFNREWLAADGAGSPDPLGRMAVLFGEQGSRRVLQNVAQSHAFGDGLRCFNAHFSALNVVSLGG